MSESYLKRQRSGATHRVEDDVRRLGIAQPGETEAWSVSVLHTVCAVEKGETEAVNLFMSNCMIHWLVHQSLSMSDNFCMKQPYLVTNLSSKYVNKMELG